MSENARDNAVAESSTPNQLARALLEVVFTQNALRLCYATSKDGHMESKTMLHQGGMKSIYTFVKATALKENWLGRQKWSKRVLKSMKRSVCSKLSEIKATEALNSAQKTR